MSPPLSYVALRALSPGGSFVVIDPGLKTGVAIVDPDVGWSVNTAALDELPGLLRHLLPGPAFLVCEDYHLLGGKAMQQSGSSMPSAQGIGMCRTACEWTDTQMFLVAPKEKRAGQMALPMHKGGTFARESCRNDHERDAVDLAGFVLREMSR